MQVIPVISLPLQVIPVISLPLQVIPVISLPLAVQLLNGWSSLDAMALYKDHLKDISLVTISVMTITGQAPEYINFGCPLCTSEDGKLRPLTRYQKRKNRGHLVAVLLESLPAVKRGTERRAVVILF